MGGNGERISLVGRPLFDRLPIYYFHFHRVEGNIHHNPRSRQFHLIAYPLDSWGAAPHSLCGEYGKENKTENAGRVREESLFGISSNFAKRGEGDGSQKDRGRV